MELGESLTKASHVGEESPHGALVVSPWKGGETQRESYTDQKIVSGSAEIPFHDLTRKLLTPN